MVFFLMAMDHMDQFESRGTLLDLVYCRTLNHAFLDDLAVGHGWLTHCRTICIVKVVDDMMIDEP